MTADPHKFEIDLDGIIYKIERSATDENIYRLSSKLGTYLLSKDFYGFWIELARKPGSAIILPNEIGLRIEEHNNTFSSC